MSLAEQWPREAGWTTIAFQADLFSGVCPNLDAFVSQHSFRLRVAG